MANISVFTKSHSRCAFYFERRGKKLLGIIGWHHRKDRGDSHRGAYNESRPMPPISAGKQRFCLEVGLRRLADDYQVCADEIEHD
jgi:hypothetical protein